MGRGLFVSFEGIDRCGKTTQANLFAEKLGDRALLVREPGGTDVGERIRALLLERGASLDPLAEALLYAAARAQLVATVIRPALQEGKVVLSDRYIDSSLAYQGHGRGLGIDAVEQVNALATGGLWPDLTFFIDVGPERAQKREGTEDRLESEGPGLQRAAAEGYHELLQRYPERMVLVDGNRPVEEVQDEIAAIAGEMVGALFR